MREASRNWEKDPNKVFRLNETINLFSIFRRKIDAVCVLGSKNEVMPQIKTEHWLRIFREYRDYPQSPFLNKRVWLIEAKKDLTGNNFFTAIGQLIYYEYHFKKDWKGLVEGKAIVFEGGVDEVTLDAVRWLKESLGIVCWQVLEDGRVAAPI
ncbi:MAG: hypothetical protein QXW94_07110 [Desulfurococcaceae archaeon]